MVDEDVADSQSVRLMKYFIESPKGGFQEDIAQELKKGQADIIDALQSLQKQGFIYRLEPPPPAIRKTVYWRLSLPSLPILIMNSEFNSLHPVMQRQGWIIERIQEIFKTVPLDFSKVLPEMIQSSPSFFQQAVLIDSLDKFREAYQPYFQIKQFLLGLDRTFVDCWVMYQVFAECCLNDVKSKKIASLPIEVLNKAIIILEKLSPISRQEECIRNLQRTIRAVILTFPYWGIEHRSIKDSIQQYISEFNVACDKAKKIQSVSESEGEEYVSVFRHILHNLAVDQYGDTADRDLYQC